MPDAAKMVRLLAALVLITAFGATRPALAAAAPDGHDNLDPPLRQRASHTTGHSQVIVTMADGAPAGIARAIVQRLGGTPGRALPIINGHAGTVPNVALVALAGTRFVKHVSLDRPIVGAMERTARATGAASVRQALGYDGAGIGVAVIDSGITSWHDDLTVTLGAGQRVRRFVDFVNRRNASYDDYGHGTHVAGIIAGNGFASGGARAGIAPAAHLIVLKVLDGSGKGHISDVIAALDYIVANTDAHNIRVVNLSVAAVASESYESDPLTIAARSAVMKGIVVVAAAGNAGRSADGRTQYGGVAAPGNAPWVLTVGASSHMGTVDRSDDIIAPFSSRGPAAGGDTAKPDLVAPGVGIESLSVRDSRFYSSHSSYLLGGSGVTTSGPSYIPYLSLSGTSMAAPVVSGTVALMLQANPALTPNQVKAILQYTAQVSSGYDTLTQGAGFLNAKGAVALAQHFAAPSSGPFPSEPDWGGRVIWGNELVEGGQLTADANAWATSVTWGAKTTPDGETIAWGVTGSAADGAGAEGVTNTWDISGTSENVVWGMVCGGDDCAQPWTTDIVHDTDDTDTVVWGMDDGDTVVWGMDDGDSVVWGMSCRDASCEPVIWSGQ